MGDTAAAMVKMKPNRVDQNRVGARPMKDVAGTQIRPPNALCAEDVISTDA